MSSSLMWRPALPIDGGTLPYELKKVISRKLWDTDGSCGSGDVVVGDALRPYLEGLRDAGVKGADSLIGLIDKYGAVVLWHEW